MSMLCSTKSPSEYPHAHFKLFGVTLTSLVPDDSAASSSSPSPSPCSTRMCMGNLSLITPSSSSSSLSQLCNHSESSEAALTGETEAEAEAAHGLAAPVHPQAYFSDVLFLQGSAIGTRDRKKGVPWSEDEHRMFLFGLQKLGKGDWRGISRNFVTTRTPTQVASHAQKYFLRQSNLNKRKRRSSLFDIISSPSARNRDTTHQQDHAHPKDFNMSAATSDLLIPHCQPDPQPIHPMDSHFGSKHDIITSSSLLANTPNAHHLRFSNPGLGAKNTMESIPTMASPSSLSSSSSTSTLSLGQFDEVAELSSLNLSIGPPNRHSTNRNSEASQLVDVNGSSHIGLVVNAISVG